MIDLAAYWERVGLGAERSLADIHRAHVTSIPFENLDPWGGRPVSLDARDVERKLVHERRGGYCFEHCLLFMAALEQSGFAVDVLLARARTGGWPGPIRPRTHGMLRVWVDGVPWLADVGFGFGGLLEPLPFGPGGPYQQSGWRSRLVQDGAELVLQAARGEDWVDQYGVVADPVPMIDIETANWLTSTYPGSPFVRGPIISATAHDGSRTLIRADSEHGLVLVEQTPEHRQITPLDRSAFAAVLHERFGLVGRMPIDKTSALDTIHAL